MVSEPTPRFWKVFLELFEGLPRQGPGNRACAAQALGLCHGLPPTAAVLDLGCGVGGQTLHLVELLPRAVITAIDCHAVGVVGARFASQLLAPVTELELELPAFESHHHATELGPGNVPAIDDDDRHAIVVIEIAVDPSAHGQTIVD